MKKTILVFLLILYTLPILAYESPENFFTEKNKIESDLKIYPNPCKTDKVTINYNSKEISEIKLTNITGKQVMQKKYDFPSAKIHLHLFDIPNGIYLIQIKTTDNKAIVKKLMVSKN